MNCRPENREASEDGRKLEVGKEIKPKEKKKEVRKAKSFDSLGVFGQKNEVTVSPHSSLESFASPCHFGSWFLF